MQPFRRGVVRKCLDDLLSRPRRSRMLRDIEMHDAPTAMRQHDQHEEDAAGERRHSEEGRWRRLTPCDSSGTSSTSGTVVLSAAAAAEKPSVQTPRSQVSATRRESAGHPTTDSRPPSDGRGCGFPHRPVDGRRMAASSVESSGGAASRDATARRFRAGPASAPCASSARRAKARSRRIDRGAEGVDASSHVWRRAVAAATQGSPTRRPGAHGKPASGRERSEAVMPARPDRGLRHQQNQPGWVLANVSDP